MRKRHFSICSVFLALCGAGLSANALVGPLGHTQPCSAVVETHRKAAFSEVYYDATTEARTPAVTSQRPDRSITPASFISSENSPPDLEPIDNATLTEGVAFSLTLSATDPDGETELSFSAIGLPTGASLDSATGEFTWLPGFAQAGEYEVVFTVSDNHPKEPLFDEATAVFTVLDANGPPDISTGEGTTSFTVAENSVLTVPLKVTDPDLSDALSVTAMLAGGLPLPDGAHVVSGEQGYRIEWETSFEQSGTYEVVLTVIDDGEPPLSASISLLIEVQNVNRPPLLEDVPPVSALENEAFAIQLAATDPDTQDTLTYSASTALPPGVVLDPETGLITWTPGFDQAGQYEITFVVSDNSEPMLSASVVIVIDVGNTNRPPVIEPIGDYLIYEGAELIVVVSVTDPDLGETVITTASMSDGAPLPTGAIFKNDVLTWAPDFQQAGTYVIRFESTDSHVPPATAEQLITVTVVNVNRAPAFLDAANQALSEGLPFALQLDVSDADTWDTHSFSLEAGAEAVLPAGLNLAPDSGLLTWTPTYAQAGEWPIRLTVTDNGNPALSAVAEIVLVVADVPHDVTLDGFFPEANAGSVASNVEVDAMFSEPMASPQPGEFAIASKWRGAIPGTVGLDGNSIQFNPSSGFLAGELVSVSASGALRSSLEASLNQPFMWQFRVATVPSEAGFSRQVAPFGSPTSDVRDIVLADFDGDGDLDALVLATSPSAANYVYRNDGAGNLAATSIVGTGAAGPAGIRTFDYDGDGATDVLYWIGSVAYIYTNAGNLQFNLEVSIPLQPGLAELEIGDMNADGRADLVTVTDTGIVTVMERDSAGFTSASTFDMGLGNAGIYLLELADVYANGRLEVVVANSGEVRILTYNSPLVSAQAFPHPAGSLKDLDVVDTNGDRLPDVYITGETLWAFVADIDDGYTSGIFLDMSGASVQDADFGDLDGDGDLDMLVAFADYTLAMLNGGNGQLFSAHEAIGNAIGADPALIQRTLAADMNGDGKLDVVNLRAQGFSRTFFNTDRLRASIQDASGVAPYTGEREVLVPVTLDFTPVNAVTVFYETIEEPVSPPPEGDDDGLPDPEEFAKGQPAPPGLGYIPKSGFLTFQPSVRTLWISITLTATTQASGSLSIIVQVTPVSGVPGLTMPGGVVVSVPVASVTVTLPGGQPSAPMPSATASEWQIEGPVNAIDSSGQVSYFGGDFDAISWSRNRLAAFDVDTGLPATGYATGAAGSFTSPFGTGAPQISVAEDDGSWVIVGGSFQYVESGTTYLSIVRLNKATGQADPTFNPSPKNGSTAGRVNAILVDGQIVTYGGHFDSARSTPTSAWTTRSHLDRIQWNAGNGVYQGISVGWVGQPAFVNTEVFALLKDNIYLFVGGRFAQASDAGGANPNTVFNIALFNHAGSVATHVYVPFFVGVTQSADHTFPDGVVRAFATAGSQIVVGGEFRYYASATGNPLSPFSWADLASGGQDKSNLLQINGAAQYSGPVPTSFIGVKPVRALKFYNSGVGTAPYHLFIGQAGSQSAPTAPSLRRGAWDGSGTLQNMGTALETVDVLAIAGTTLLAGTRSTPTDFWASPTIRRYELAVGANFATLNPLPNSGNGELGALAVDSSGYVIAFGGFTRFGVGRSNLAARDDVTSALLDWRPRPAGPVHAVHIVGQAVYYGGQFGSVNEIVGLSNLSPSPIAGLGSPDQITNWGGAHIRTNGPVYALASNSTATAVYIGGSFTHVNNVDPVQQPNQGVRYAMAAINPASGGLYPLSPMVFAGSGPGTVRALVVTSTQVYLGGYFTHVSAELRAGLARVDASTGALDTNWSVFALGGGGEVRALALDSPNGVLFAGGTFAQLGGQSRANLGAVNITNGQTLAGWQADTNGAVNALALTTSGWLHVGGEFTQIGSSNVSSAAQIDGLSATVDQNWSLAFDDPDPGVGLPRRISAIHLSLGGSQGRITFGGWFSDGLTSPPRRNLAWWDLPRTLTPSGLPIGAEGVDYSAQFAVSDGSAASWALGSGLDPLLLGLLQVGSSTGQLISVNPQTQQPAPFPIGLCAPYSSRAFSVPVVATLAGGIVLQRTYVLQIEGATRVTLEPNLTSAPRRSLFVEDDQTAAFLPSALELRLSKPSSAEIRVDIESIPGTAIEGRDFAFPDRTAVFPPNTTSCLLPLTVFGDDIVGASPRLFTLRIKQVTSGVAGIEPNSDVEVWIIEDDVSGPMTAIADELAVFNDPLSIADQTHVLANSPFFAWRFVSDDPVRQQAAFRAEVFLDSAPPILVWDSGFIQSSDEMVVCGQVLSDGASYWLRVTLQDDQQVFGTSAVAGFRLNTRPSVVFSQMLQEPGGMVSDATPNFVFDAPTDADGDAMQFLVTVFDSAGNTVYSVDSAISHLGFSYFDSLAGWIPLSALGVPNGAQTVKLAWPTSLALSNGTYTWQVDVSDSFEWSVGVVGSQFTLSASYTFFGVVVDSTGVVDVAYDGQQVVLVQIETGAVLGTATSVQGTFVLVASVGLEAGEELALCLDDARAAPLRGATLFQFTGADMGQGVGPTAVLSVAQGKITCDQRTVTEMTAAVFRIPVGNQDVRLGFERTSSTDVSLFPWVQSLAMNGDIELSSPSALLPSNISCSFAPGTSCTLDVPLGSSLMIEDSSALAFQHLNVDGELTVNAAELTLTETALIRGLLRLLTGSFVHSDSAVLRVEGSGVIAMQGATLEDSTNASSVEAAAGGLLTLHQSTFAGVRVVVRHDARLPAIEDIQFAGTPNSMPAGSSSTSFLLWELVQSPSSGDLVSFRGVQFVSAPGLNEFNVAAASSADRLVFLGSGGAGAGETCDDDPGELVGADLVMWELTPVENLLAESGDGRVLLTWEGGDQAFGTFSYWVYRDTSATLSNPVKIVETTDEAFVDTGLSNLVPYYYVVLVGDSLTGLPASETSSEMASATPESAALNGVAPAECQSDGITALTIIGSGTHWDENVYISVNDTSFVVIAESVHVISPSLIVVEIEATSATAGGVVQVSILQQAIWGVQGYDEDFTADLDIVESATGNAPQIAFTTASNGVQEGEVTTGAFDLTLEWDADTGATIDPTSLEVYSSRVVHVSGVVVSTPGIPGALNLDENLALTAYQIFTIDPNTQTAVAHIDQPAQIGSTTPAGIERIDAGVCVFAARVRNSFGVLSGWAYRTVYVDGYQSDVARTNESLEQGERKTITMRGTGIASAVSVVFPTNSGIAQFGSLQLIGSQPILGGLDYEVDGTFDCADDCITGSVDAEVWDASGSLATITFDIEESYHDWSPPGQTAGHNAAVGGVNVNLQTGHFFWETTDLETGGRALPIKWSRCYRSDTGQETALGRGWSNEYLQFITVDVFGDVTWVDRFGERFEFDKNPAVDEYSSPEGVAVELTKSGNAYVLTTSSGYTVEFGHSVGFKERVTRIRDTYGNCTKCEYQSASYGERDRLIYILNDVASADSALQRPAKGEGLRIDYTPSGRVESVHHVVANGTGWIPSNTGWGTVIRSVKYERNFDLLTAVYLPETERFKAAKNTRVTCAYAYDSDDRLELLFNPNDVVPLSNGTPNFAASTPFLKNKYDLDDMVVEQNADGRVTTISYNGTISTETKITKPRGNVCVYTLDNNGQTTQLSPKQKFSDPDEFAVAMQYDKQRLTKVVQPKGDYTEYIYGAGPQLLASWNSQSLIDVAVSDVQFSTSQNRTKVQIDLIEPFGPTGGPFAPVSHILLSQVAADAEGDASPLQVRYYPVTVVEKDAVYVPANLEADGWNPEENDIVASFFFGVTDPLMAHQPTQTILSPGAGAKTSEQFITYTRWEEVYINDIKHIDAAITYHPFATEITTRRTTPGAHASGVTYKSWRASSVEVLTRLIGGTTAKDTLESIVDRDGFGRVAAEHGPLAAITDYQTEVRAGRSPRTLTKYEYYDEAAAAPATLGRLKNAIAFEDGNGEQLPWKTSYFYDSRGVIEKIVPPSGNTSSQVNDDFATLFKVNNLGQMWAVEGPKIHGTSQRPIALAYFDKNGNETYRVRSWLPGSALHGQTSANIAIPTGADGFSDPVVENTFKVTFAQVSGWVTIRMSYSRLNEVQSVTKPHISWKADDASTTLQTSVTSSFGYNSNGMLAWSRRPHILGWDAVEILSYNERDLVTTQNEGVKSASLPHGALDPYFTARTNVAMQYDRNGNVTSATDSLGRKTSFGYDAVNRLVSVTHPVGASGKALVETTEYSKPFEFLIYKVDRLQVSGEETTEPTGLQRWSKTFIDGAGRVYEQRTRAVSRTGAPLSAVDEGGEAGFAVQRFEYGPTNMLEGTQSADRVYLSHAYDGLGRHRVTRGYPWPKNIELRDEYAASGVQHTHIDQSLEWQAGSGPIGSYVTDYKNQTVMDLDGFGNPIKVTDADGVVKELKYDGDGRLCEEKLTKAGTQPASIEVRTYLYDLDGNPMQVSVERASDTTTTRTAYDPDGKVIAEWIQVDDGGGMTQVWRKTGYQYDALGRLYKKTLPDSGTYTYGYDLADRATLVTYPTGMTVSYEYSAMDELKKVEVGNRPMAGGGFQVRGAVREEYTYDEWGQVASDSVFNAGQAAPVVKNDYLYNSLGQVEEATQTVRLPDGTLAPVTFSAMAGEYIDPAKLGFAPLSAYTGGTSFSAWTSNCDYNAAGMLKKLKYWDGRELRYEYDVLARINKIEEITGGPEPGLMASFEYLGWDRLMKRSVFQHGSRGSGYRSQRQIESSFDYTEAGRVLERDTRKRIFNSTFSAFHRAYDEFGRINSERWYENGGRGRVWQYDDSGRLTGAAWGVPLDLQTNLQPTTTALSALGAAWRTAYDIDQADNFKKIEHFAVGNVTARTDTFARDTVRNTYGQRTEQTHDGTSSGSVADAYTYDELERLETDGSTGLQNYYDYAGRLVEVWFGTTQVRQIVYDALGRKTLEVAGTTDVNKLYTLTIHHPEGPGGELGPNALGEVCFNYIPSAGTVATEAVQFTNGLGLTGNGVGEKRIIEFVCYRLGEKFPFYIHLVEDALGSTVSTVSQVGLCRDQYEYEDYGRPIWKPTVDVFDGSAVQRSQNFMVSITASETNLEPCTGREISVAGYFPTGTTTHRYATAMVMDNDATHINVFDPTGDFYTAYTASSTKQFAVHYGDSGHMKVRIIDVQVEQRTINGQQEVVTELYIEYSAFADLLGGSVTIKDTDSQSAANWLNWGSQTYSDIYLSEYIPEQALLGTKVIGIKGDLSTVIDIGDILEADLKSPSLTLAGRVSSATTSAGSGSGATVYTEIQLDARANLSVRMEGWQCQPNTAYPVYFDVMSVNPSTYKIVLAGDATPLYGGNLAGVADENYRFMLFMPPGISPHTDDDGAMSHSPNGWTTSCLFAGYKYVSPLAGFNPGGGPTGFVAGQSGENKAGLYYVWNRWYDPALGRFTTPDPADSPFYNLNAYCGADPVGCYDPEGLSVGGMVATLPLVVSPLAPIGLALLAWQAYDTYDSASNDKGTASVLIGENRGKGYDRDGLTGIILGNNTYERSNMLNAAGENDGVTVAALWAADLFGVTNFAEGVHGVDSTTANSLTTTDRVVRTTLGTLTMAGYASMAFGGGFGTASSTAPLKLAQIEANAAQSTLKSLHNRLQPRTVGAMVKGSYRDVARTRTSSGPHHFKVQEVLDRMKVRSDVHGLCVEPKLLSAALRAGVNPKGGAIFTVRVRPYGKLRHGSPISPCASCRQLLSSFGVDWTARTAGSRGPWAWGGAGAAAIGRTYEPQRD